MHRSLGLPRLVGCWSMVLLFALQVGLNSAAAQQPPAIADVPVLVMGAGTSQVVQMSNKEKLKLVTNPNPKVLNVSKIDGDPTAVLVEALVPGRVRVTLTDTKDKSEAIDIVVISDRVKDLRDLIQRSAPTAAVTVGANGSNTLVVLSGYVMTEPDAKLIRAAALNLFGPNVVDNIRIGGVQQVQLEVVVAVVNRSRVRNMSFSWAANGNEWFFSSIFGGPFTFTNNVATGVFNSISPVTGSNITNTPAGTFNLPFGVIHNNNNFLSFLNLLTTDSVVKILANPTVTTLSGRPAYVVSGGRTPVIVASSGGSSVTYQQFGTVVNCLPTVLGGGKILLEVRPEVSAVDPTLAVSIGGISPAAAPGFDVRSAQVTVMVEDGQTIAIGGLIQNKVTATISKVPVLGDLPFLSPFFQQKSYNEQEEEMLILVTPRLIDPVDCTKIPRFLPGRETRSPDDFEFFLEGILEAPRDPRTVMFHPSLYKGAFKNAPNNGIPCADGSCGPGCANGNCGGVLPTAFRPGAMAPMMPTVPAAPQVPSAAPAPRAVAPRVVANPSVPAASTKAVAAPKVVASPSVPPLPAPSGGNRFTIEAEPTAGLIPPSVGSAPSVPTVPPLTAPASEAPNRPALPPIGPTPPRGSN